MNLPPENELTDEQLDGMLRDVQIPADLKRALKCIPARITAIEEADHAPQTAQMPRKTTLSRAIPASSVRTRWLTYALAASLLVAATFLTARFLNRRTQGTAPTATKTDADTESTPDLASGDLIVRPDHESGNQNPELRLLQAEVQELEITRLESELFQLEQLNSSRLSQFEIESMIMALAPEHSLALGGDEAYVRSEMARVQRDYPNTRGAMLAGEVLQTVN